MAMLVRNLLGRIKPFRSDIATDTPAINCLNTAIRDVCRDTRMARTVIAPQPVYSFSTSITPTTSLGDVLQIERVTFANIPKGNYIDTFNPTTGDLTVGTVDAVITGSASAYNDGDFVMALNASSTVIDGSDESWEIGDIAYCSNDEWIQLKVREFKESCLVNRVTAQLDSKSPQGEYGNVSCCYIDGNVIKPVPSLQYDDVVSIEVSYVPSADLVTSVPLPIRTEEAVVNLALSRYYMLPGTEQDKRSAELFRRKALIEIGNLQAWSVLGENGSSTLPSINFTGRW